MCRRICSRRSLLIVLSLLVIVPAAEAKIIYVDRDAAGEETAKIVIEMLR